MPHVYLEYMEVGGVFFVQVLNFPGSSCIIHGLPLWGEYLLFQHPFPDKDTCLKMT